jgi:hypothetical protein
MNVDRALVDGVGGLGFQAQSPPGIGRLLRLPFYLLTATAGYTALDGTAGAAVSATHPGVNLAPPAALGGTATATLSTPTIPWAVLRIVGFEVNIRYPAIPVSDVMDLAFQNLQIGGGTSLFVHANFGAGAVYLVGQGSFAGLRDYPLLRSPNTASVQVQGVGNTALAGCAPVNFSSNLVCEVLVDNNFGAHIPGPYARQGALVRSSTSI